jgi:hypothetical protein
VRAPGDMALCGQLGIAGDFATRAGAVRHKLRRAVIWIGIDRPSLPASSQCARKCFRIMLPFWSEAADRQKWDRENACMWGRSHRLPCDCGRLKNLASPIEPSAASPRPTLRDGL